MSKKPPRQLTAVQELAAEYSQYQCRKHPTIPANFFPRWKGSDRTKEGRINCISTKIKIDGGFVERVSKPARVLDGRIGVQDCIGRRRTIGSVDYIPATNASFDILATTISGTSFKIRVEEDDKQAGIKSSDAFFIIVTSYADFLNHYQQIISK